MVRKLNGGWLDFCSGDLSLSLAPSVGGSIASLTWRGMNVLRPSDGESNTPLGLGCFPMVPFAGRIAAGIFEFEGQKVSLKTNLSDPHHAIHGQGWRGPWQVISQTADSARLGFDYVADDWPWSYQAEQSFHLTTDRLVHTLSIINQSQASMPAGLGLHPYFPRSPDMQLRAKIDSYFPTDPTLLPLETRAPPGHLDWSLGSLIPTHVDNPFGGWDGVAEMFWPDRDLVVRMATQPSLSNLVVYAPEGQDFICVEPISHEINALNTAPGSMKVLAPSAKLTISVTFDIANGRDKWTD